MRAQTLVCIAVSLTILFLLCLAAGDVGNIRLGRFILSSNVELGGEESERIESVVSESSSNLLWYAVIVGFQIAILVCTRRIVRKSTAAYQPDASPNDGPTTLLGNSEVSEGPPSVS
jgi:hypothetical protein